MTPPISEALHKAVKKFCRKNIQTGKFEFKWFITDHIPYVELEAFLIEHLHLLYAKGREDAEREMREKTEEILYWMGNIQKLVDTLLNNPKDKEKYLRSSIGDINVGELTEFGKYLAGDNRNKEQK